MYINNKNIYTYILPDPFFFFPTLLRSALFLSGSLTGIEKRKKGRHVCKLSFCITLNRKPFFIRCPSFKALDTKWLHTQYGVGHAFQRACNGSSRLTAGSLIFRCDPWALSTASDDINHPVRSCQPHGSRVTPSSAWHQRGLQRSIGWQ